MRFTDRVVIVTGAGSGRVMAGRFGAEGASVVSADRVPDSAERDPAGA